MRLSVILALFIQFVAIGEVVAQQKVTLTTPIVRPSHRDVSIERVTIDVRGRTVFIQWIYDTGEPGSAVYSTPDPVPGRMSGARMINRIRTGNYGAQAGSDLFSFLLRQLQGDGFLGAGTVGGTPEVDETFPPPIVAPPKPVPLRRSPAR